MTCCGYAYHSGCFCEILRATAAGIVWIAKSQIETFVRLTHMSIAGIECLKLRNESRKNGFTLGDGRQLIRWPSSNNNTRLPIDRYMGTWQSVALVHRRIVCWYVYEFTFSWIVSRQVLFDLSPGPKSCPWLWARVIFLSFNISGSQFAIRELH